METKSRHPVSGLESHLGYWLRRVSNRVSGAFARSLQAQNTSVAEWVLLRRLDENEPASPGELAETLTMTRGAISKIIDKLEAKGWIACQINPEDNRAQMVHFTRLGRRTLPSLATIADRNDEEFFHCLNASERKELQRLLRKLAESHQIQDVPVA